MLLGRREGLCGGGASFGAARAALQGSVRRRIQPDAHACRGRRSRAAPSPLPGSCSAPTSRPASCTTSLSRAYVGANRIQDAYDALRTATRLEPSEEQHYLDLALHLSRSRELRSRRGDRRRRAAHIPALGHAARVPRRAAGDERGSSTQAEREFETARRLWPGWTRARRGARDGVDAVGECWASGGLAQRGCQGGTREAVVPYMLGIALMRTGIDAAAPEGAEAIAAFEAAIKLDPTLAGPRTELGKALLRRGDTQRAIEQLELCGNARSRQSRSAVSARAGLSADGEHRSRTGALARVTKLNEQGRCEDPDKELKRIVVRIVREGAAPPARR